MDRKRRLAAVVARERGWDARTVSTWLIVSRDRTNERALALHRAMTSGRLSRDRGNAMHRWLSEIRKDAFDALSLPSYATPVTLGGRGCVAVRRPDAERAASAEHSDVAQQDLRGRPGLRDRQLTRRHPSALTLTRTCV